MAQSAGLHEPEDQMSADVIDRHRALNLDPGRPLEA